MADYTYGQLEELWIKAGGNKALAPLMAAIALAESSGNPNATNPTDNGGTQTSWGLWQISDGTHNQPVAGILDPLTNAKAAVAKYRSQGLGAWGTYTSGAYQQFYKGDVVPTNLPQGGNSQTQNATLTGWTVPSIPGPLGIPGEIASAIAGLWDNAGKLGSTVDALTQIARGFTVVLHAFEWLFVPSHWVRIIAFISGLFFAIPGLYALMKSANGTSGDATLALGILLVTVSGILFFIAFHNLPDDVRSLASLLQWIAASIHEGKPAASGVEPIPTGKGGPPT